jgi:hypothetical protein
VFDPNEMRASMWRLYEQKRASVRAAECEYGKIVWICPNGSNIEPRWNVWGRILQWCGPRDWRVFWFPHPSKRRIPTDRAPGPGDVNGGYTIPCKTNCIVVYRHEDAERVLLHELAHAACLDNFEESITYREARTELWAELFMVALFSKGNLRAARALWNQQAAWILNQNRSLRKHANVNSADDYVWRYTVGRENIANELRIAFPPVRPMRVRSLRLAAPIFDTLSL